MTHRPYGLAIFISGRGSNMKALIDAAQDDDFPAQVVLVIADNPDAPGLAFAREKNIPVTVVDRSHFTDRDSFEHALHSAVSAYPVDLICLAGFMRLLSASFIALWPDRIVNIHPSLLPAYKGLDTHARALADGVSETGCSVHFVRPAMDAGPVILQRAVPVLAGDTEDLLADRVLAQEHIAYPQAVRLIAEGRVKIHDEAVEILSEAV